MTFECADCPLVGDAQGDVYAAERDDLMIDQLLLLPPSLSLFSSPSLSSPAAVLCLVLIPRPHPHPSRPRYLVLSPTQFNKISIAHMATYCPLAAGAIKITTCLHLFINECVPPPAFTSQDQVVHD